MPIQKIEKCQTNKKVTKLRFDHIFKELKIRPTLFQTSKILKNQGKSKIENFKKCTKNYQKSRFRVVFTGSAAQAEGLKYEN